MRPPPASTSASSLLLALGAGLVLFAVFPPLDLGPLALVALAPWTCLVLRAASFRQALFGSLLAGLAFNVPGFFWLRHVTWEGMICAFLIATAYNQLFTLAVWSARRLPDAAFVPVAAAAWIAAEYLRSTLFFIAFPWLLLGHGLHGIGSLIQSADLGGVWPLGFACALAGVSLGRWWNARRSGPSLAWPALVMAPAMLAGLAAYGAWRAREVEPKLLRGPTIGLVQGDVPQSLKTEGRSWEQILDQHLALTRRLYALGPCDLVLWPETMVPDYLPENEYLLGLLGDLAREGHANLLVGAVNREPAQAPPEAPGSANPPDPPGAEPRYRFHNSAFVIDRDGELVGRYDKIFLVPLGELVPFEHSIPPLHRLLSSFLPPGFSPFEAGRGEKVFELAGARFAPDICFEVSFADHVRRASRAGAQVLASISNDAWFQDGVELELARVQGKFRAVETRMAVLRCVNRGISSVMDPLGRVSDLKDAAGRSKGVEGVLRSPILLSPEAGRTIYARIGDAFAWLCLAITLMGLVAGFRANKGARVAGAGQR